MTSDPLLLAPALVSPDLTAGDLLALAGFPAADIPKARENLLRRWKRAGLIEPFGVRLSGRPFRAPDDGDDLGPARMVREALEAGFRGSVAALAFQLGAVDERGKPTKGLERVVEVGIEDGWLLPVRAIQLTLEGEAMVLSCPDPEIDAIVIRERRARESVRDLARVTDGDVAAVDAETRAVLAMAELTRGRPVLRARAEEMGRRGLPARTVPARFRRAG